MRMTVLLIVFILTAGSGDSRTLAQATEAHLEITIEGVLPSVPTVEASNSVEKPERMSKDEEAETAPEPEVDKGESPEELPSDSQNSTKAPEMEMSEVGSAILHIDVPYGAALKLKFMQEDKWRMQEVRSHQGHAHLKLNGLPAKGRTTVCITATLRPDDDEEVTVSKTKEIELMGGEKHYLLFRLNELVLKTVPEKLPLRIYFVVPPTEADEPSTRKEPQSEPTQSGTFHLEEGAISCVSGPLKAILTYGPDQGVSTIDFEGGGVTPDQLELKLKRNIATFLLQNSSATWKAKLSTELRLFNGNDEILTREGDTSTKDPEKKKQFEDCLDRFAPKDVELEFKCERNMLEVGVATLSFNDGGENLRKKIEDAVKAVLNKNYGATHMTVRLVVESDLGTDSPVQIVSKSKLLATPEVVRTPEDELIISFEESSAQ